MLTFPNAKINIGLYITEKRPDGYHNLETVFYPITLQDSLELITTNEAQSNIHFYGSSIPGNPFDNLVWKAYQQLRKDFPNKVQPVDIHLLKNIPMGAGLGGGSADGAFMLSLLNNFFDLALSKESLAQYALELGSDCPFFIYNKPSFAKGRGEILSAVTIDLSGFSLQLVCPQIHISTALAFKGIVPRPAPFDLSKIAELPIEEWQQNISNDFEDTLFPQYPQLEQIKTQLLQQGAIYASLSGTGATVYGIFPKDKSAEIHLDTPFENYVL